MQLQPTAKARLDLHPGVQTLTMRERSLLLFAVASKPSAELRRLFHGMGEEILTDLVRQGYLAPVASPPVAATPTADGDAR